MSTQPRIDEKGNAVVHLGQRNIFVKFRQPKGKDLVALELAAKDPEATNVGIMMTLITILSVEPKLTYEEVEDLEAGDIVALAEVLKTFRGLGKLAS